MLNLTEKHVVVVIVLIAIIFLLFLSTRTPICAKEGFTGKNNYAELNNDLFINEGSNAPVDFTNNDTIKQNNNDKPLLLTKSDMFDLKGAYKTDTEIEINEFDSSYDENLHNKKATYASISEELDEIIENKIDDIIEKKITLVKKEESVEILDDKPLLNDKPFDYENNCSEEIPEVPEGRDISYNFSPFGLIREQIKSFDLENNIVKLDEDKCSILRGAVLNLNKTGVIKNNNVESSWNNTFKDTCGNW